MQVDGEFEVRAPPEEVFAFLADPKRLLDCLDDPHTVEKVDADRFQGTLTTGVAFIRGTFRYTGSYEEREPGRRLKTRMHGTGLGSGLDAVLTAELSGAGGGTKVGWHADIVLSGPAATIGERVIKSTIEKKSASMFENVRKALEGASKG